MKSYEVNIRKIMRTLLGSSQYLTLSDIANSVNLSKRSIQNYLADIDSWVLQNRLVNTYVARKPSQGIKLETNVIDRKKIEKLLQVTNLSVNADDNKRRLDIIKKLIVLKENTTVRFLAEQFYTNRATILSDLQWISQWLTSYKLKLDIPQRRAIEITGEEIAFRNAIAGYFDFYWASDFEEPTIIKRREAVNEKTIQNLTTIYPANIVSEIQKIIEETEKEFSFILTGEYYGSLLTHIVISVTRLLSGNTVAPEFHPQNDEEFPALEMATAEFMSLQLEKVFAVKVSDLEKQYICIYLVGFNALSSSQKDSDDIPSQIKKLALELIKDVDYHMESKFISDELLFYDLCVHLKYKIYRLQKDVHVREISDFKLSGNEYIIYHAVNNASYLYYDICEVSADEEEILKVTCYFILSQRRNQRKTKALLICDEGIFNRLELMDFITSVLPSVEIINCCSSEQLKLLSITDCDFIISTENVKSAGKPVVEVSDIERENFSKYILDFLFRVGL